MPFQYYHAKARLSDDVIDGEGEDAILSLTMKYISYVKRIIYKTRVIYATMR
jgi:hypothetical protein